jgi:transcriptional regulator with XRE-family HTH domain
MATSSSQEDTSQGSGTFMIPLDLVVMMAWNLKYGENLRAIRGTASRREIARRVASYNIECSQEYIRKLEQGTATVVSTKIIIALAQSLEVELAQLIPCLQITVSPLLVLTVDNLAT